MYERPINQKAGIFRSSLITSRTGVVADDFPFTLYESGSEITETLHQLKTNRNEVVVLHLVGRTELEFDYQGALTLQDLESGRKVRINPGQAREAYLERLQTRLEAIRADLLSRNIGYARLVTDQPLEEALPLYLKTRNRAL